jgi:uncharacterized membrane protein YiaA
MTIKSAVVATADRYQAFSAAVTSVGAVYWLGAMEGLWAILAVLFTSDRGAHFALCVVVAFRALSYLQLKARAYLELTGTSLPKPAQGDDGTSSDSQ